MTILNSFFDYFYVGLILMAIIVSLTTPVDRGVAYFKFLMVCFGILLLLTMAGIIVYLAETGFFPEVLEYHAD
jgi:hypothetical protein